ncbi:Bifunctional polymyxin resistance protein ArnA [Pseudovibrio sp. Ad46]|uniref:NAD-dependent epimerase/dehydratase family protein n=1 Tax=unclassified Pseudovibrio TaxID=2627060 RepID=UPI0007AE8AF3|nr:MULTISPECIES: NAD-dependent epimerase/dehydratase family protein [unclassified Pseudovibrio]KZK94706.1 Bifunctional polymyxin resistance protein ArnA [Pseudovibrio sp. Ad46]KZL01626.1 Bifunctional polymyxin resistance protein ArnA [Pseudovibrio sp. Ad5]
MFSSKAEVIKQDIFEFGSKIDANELLFLSDAKILVTGSTGLIGFYIVAAMKYLNEKHNLGISLYCSSRDITAAMKLFSGYFECSGIEVVEYGKENISGPYDLIFHTASSTNPVELAKRPLNVIETNVQYTNDLLKLLKEKTGNFVFFSTREIYGKKVDLTKKYVSETDYGVLDPLEIRSAYPESKRLGENMVASYGMQFGNPYRVVRISHTYGPGIKLNDGRVLSDIIGAMVSNDDINLKSDGTHQISPTYVADVVAGLLVSLIRGEDGCYNISNHKEIYSVYDIAKIAADNSPDAEVTRKITPEKSSLYLKHDTGILLSNKIMDLGWDFSVSLEDGLGRVYSHYKLSA